MTGEDQDKMEARGERLAVDLREASDELRELASAVHMHLWSLRAVLSHRWVGSVAAKAGHVRLVEIDVQIDTARDALTYAEASIVRAAYLLTRLGSPEGVRADA